MTQHKHRPMAAVGLWLVALALTFPLGGCDPSAAGDGGAGLGDGAAVLDAQQRQQILGELFASTNSHEAAFTGQYDSRFLDQPDVPDDLPRGGEVLVLAEDSCFGRKEFFIYPDGRMTCYVESLDGVAKEVVQLDAQVVARLQEDMINAGFFDLSVNLVNFKRFLVDEVPVVERGRLSAPRSPMALKEDGFTLSLKVMHPILQTYHTMHVYELHTMRQRYPQVAEYELFEQCVRRVLQHVPSSMGLEAEGFGA